MRNGTDQLLTFPGIRAIVQELFTALVVLCLGAGVIGFLLGILYAHSH